MTTCRVRTADRSFRLVHFPREPMPTPRLFNLGVPLLLLPLFLTAGCANPPDNPDPY